MELLVIPKTLDSFKYDADGFIIGVKGLSVSYNVSLSIDELEEFENKDKLFLAINKVMFNKDIEVLEDALRKIEKMNVRGVLFYDLSVLSIVRRLKLNINLVWNQTHMVTNYNTCNYYYNMGCMGCYLANEITLDEMVEIKNKSSLKVFANIISKPIMSHSRRRLLTNYFTNLGKTKEKDIYEIGEKVSGHKYIIREENDGTSIIYGNIVNGIEPLLTMIDNNFDYGIIDETYLSYDEFNNAFNLVSDILNSRISHEDAIKKGNDLFGTDSGFFYKKTIYKVK